MAVEITGLSTKQLKEKRADLVANARKFLEANESNWDDQKEGQYGAMIQDASDYTAAIKRREAVDEQANVQFSQSRPLTSPQDGFGANGDYRNQPTIRVRRGSCDKSGNPIYATEAAGKRGTAAYQEAFDKVLRFGANSLAPEERAALQSDDNEQAGYLVASEQLAAGILQEVDDEVFIRRYAMVHSVPEATSLGIRKRTARMNTFAFGQELQVSTADSSLKFGKKILTPHHMTGQILVSRDLLRRSGLIVPIVQSEASRNSGEVMEDKYLLGSGAQEPLGVFTPSTDGISTARDVSTGSATSITADGLIDAKFALKAAYRNAAVSPRWLFHRDAIKIVSKLKDTTNQYLWQPGLQAGQPDRLLNFPVDESERVPNTFTTGLYVGLLAVWRYYEIADALDMEIQQLNELYAGTNQVGWIFRMKTDGLPTLEEAFVRLKTA
jgi:HK97 family phage major capsid protein